MILISKNSEKIKSNLIPVSGGNFAQSLSEKLKNFVNASCKSDSVCTNYKVMCDQINLCSLLVLCSDVFILIGLFILLIMLLKA